MAKAIRIFELNNGAKIPSVGHGTWKAAAGVVGGAVTAAIKVKLITGRAFVHETFGSYKTIRQLWAGEI